MSCECKIEFDNRKCNSNQKWNNDKFRCESNNPKEDNAFEKDYIWNPATCNCQNGKYGGSIIDDSVNVFDEIIETTKNTSTTTFPTKSTSAETFPTKTVPTIMLQQIYVLY